METGQGTPISKHSRRGKRSKVIAVCLMSWQWLMPLLVRHGVLLLLIIGSVAAFSIFKREYFARNPAFMVKPEEIKIRGNAMLSRELVLKMFHLDSPVNGFDVVRGDMVTRLRKQSPQLKNVQMTYEPGNGLELWVEERSPLARLPGALPLVVDADGVCFMYPRTRNGYPELRGFDVPDEPSAQLPETAMCMLRLIAVAIGPKCRFPVSISWVTFIGEEPEDGLRVVLADGRSFVIAWEGMATERSISEGMVRRLQQVATVLRNPLMRGKKHLNAMAINRVAVAD